MRTQPSPVPKRSRPSVGDEMLPWSSSILRLLRETPDSVTLMLEAKGNASATWFLPGQFNMLYALGLGEIPISICGDPEKTDHLLHTIRSVGPVSQALSKLRCGDAVGVRGPYGNGWPMQAALGQDVVVVAGGIGLAPLRPALYHIFHRRIQFGRVVLLYGARSPQDLLYRKELEHWRGRFDANVHVIVDRGGLHWHGDVGVVSALVPRAPFDAESAIALVCGPERMMRFAILQLLEKGVAKDRIYLSMERNMHCGIGLCGHCQFGATFVCRDGPVYRFDQIEHWLRSREI